MALGAFGTSGSNRLKHNWQRIALWLGLALCSTLLILLGSRGLALPTLAQDPAPSERAPALQVHPLPTTLAQWQDATQQGDYFDAVQPIPAGYLIWSQFPVRVYVEPATVEAGDRTQAWVTAVTQAVQEWTAHLPLTLVDSPTAADITIWRRTPPLTGWGTGNLQARSAETQYEIFVDRPADAPARLTHRCTILLRPSQTVDYIRAAARHELGHALGIWGHSPLTTDALYFSQVRHPPPISVRDVNTLKRIYEQPTRLGWAIDDTQN